MSSTRPECGSKVGREVGYPAVAGQRGCHENAPERTGQYALVPVDVYLRDERGNTLDAAGGDGVVEKVLPSIDDPLSPCLRFVDPYGDTVFNSLQARVLAVELRASVEGTSVERIASLADRCATGTHLYLWFVGD